VDAPADDATREWREWQANQDQIAAIEKLEQGLFLQKKMRQALIRARLYGGACLMIGVKDGKEPEEELDIDSVGKGDLRYIVVLNRYELNAGPRIYDVGSPWYTRPQYYSVSTPLSGFEVGEGGDFDPNNPLSYKSNLKGDPFFQVTPNSGLLRVHPSRIVEFAGNELPDWRLAPLGGGWGDSVLQTVDDALKDWAMTVAGIASMVNDAKVDVISVPGLSERASSQKYRDKLIQRFSVANMSKSINNSLLIDKDELWERIKTNFGDVLQLLREMMVVVAGAGRIPVSRLMGQSPGRGLSIDMGDADADHVAYMVVFCKPRVTAHATGDFNPNHDPVTGRFTSGKASGGGATSGSPHPATWRQAPRHNSLTLGGRQAGSIGCAHIPSAACHRSRGPRARPQSACAAPRWRPQFQDTLRKTISSRTGKANSPASRFSARL
jgi:hypothetical protein